MIKLYTDGACKNTTTKDGGWSYIAIFPNGSELDDCGWVSETTNNRMEIQAVIEGLERIKSFLEPITVFTDSMYIVDSMTKWIAGWKRNGWQRRKGKLLNVDLWEKMDALNQSLNISWRWVKGHNGDKYNEMCDMMAEQIIENSVFT